MAIASEAAENPTSAVVGFWTNSCNQFLDWQRKHLVMEEPGPEILKAHSHSLAMMIHIGRILYAEFSDQNPKSFQAREIFGKLLQLEQSWSMIHNPMSAEESDAILGGSVP